MLNVFKFMKLDYLVIKKQLVKAILLMIIALAIIIVSANILSTKASKYAPNKVILLYLRAK